MTATPAPSLRYSWLDHPGVDVVAIGLPIHTVFEVTAWRHHGEITAWVRGRMRKKDGTPGPQRGSEVVIGAAQPPWLEAIITDARRRLEVSA